jgi:hypothetical protein
MLGGEMAMNGVGELGEGVQLWGGESVRKAVPRRGNLGGATGSMAARPALVSTTSRPRGVVAGPSRVGVVCRGTPIILERLASYQTYGTRR